MHIICNIDEAIAINGAMARPRTLSPNENSRRTATPGVARHADLLFASGELAALARAGARPFVPYETFDDVRRGLERRIVPIASRR